METFDLLATTAFGLEAVCAREIESLGYEATIISTGRVLFRAGAIGIARANLWLRTADRVLLRVGHFNAPDFEALFQGTMDLAWERWIPPDFAFPVQGRSVRSQLSSVPAVQRTVKKAIVERLRRAHAAQDLPETGDRTLVEVAILDNTCTITIDTSGVGLHKRGYRDRVGEAALKETLAAGLVLLSVWRSERPLIDPFCGSGTIAIEAALIGRNIAPGRTRDFDSAHWPAIPGEVWDEADEEARDLERPDLPVTIHASDISADALALARHHASLAGVERSIHFTRRDFAELASKADYGCIIANPPYGVRLGEDADVERLYELLPSVLRRLPTWSHHILTARPDFERTIGQLATRRRKLFNAQIECTYYTFLGPRPPRVGEPEHSDTTRSDEPAHAQPREDRSPETRAAPTQVRERTVQAPAFGGLRERDVRELDDFESRLAKRARHLRKWPSRLGITCYRLYDRDCPDVPLVIDRYEDHAHVFETEREHSRSVAQHADWLDAVRARIARVLEIPFQQVHIKQRARQRGTSQHERVSSEGVTLTAHEAGLRFEVNLSDYADTGLFLDHRQTRAMFQALARNERVLNLFCYTASFSVYAAAGGAESTTSVDLSATYLDWAARNFALNAIAGVRRFEQRDHTIEEIVASTTRSGGGVHRLVRADVMSFLRSHPKGEFYDLAVIDPPTFSNSKRTPEDFVVQEAHAELITLAASLMTPAGTIFFSNNFRQFRLDEAALRAAGLHATEISHRTVPPDFRNQRIHRCWKITRGEARESDAPPGSPIDVDQLSDESEGGSARS